MIDWFGLKERKREFDRRMEERRIAEARSLAQQEKLIRCIRHAEHLVDIIDDRIDRLNTISAWAEAMDLKLESVGRLGEVNGISGERG